MTLIVEISNQAGNWAGLDDKSVSAAARAAWGAIVKKQNEAEVSIVLADDAFVQDLNARFRDQDKPTNVLSFPMDDPRDDAESLTLGAVHRRHLGDIVLALETITREAGVQDKPFTDHARHLIVHGVLHLLGLDHQDDAAAIKMESREIEILAGLDIANPYIQNPRAVIA
jgi:probable rRNA maturation factor